MKKQISKLLMLVILVLAMPSCKKEKPFDNNGQPNEVAVGTLNLGTSITVDFQGRVVDESGNPVANVSITVGNKTTSTDAHGLFVVKDASVKEKLAYVKAQKSGYFSGSRSLIPTTSSSNYVMIQLMTLNVAGTIASGTEATVTTNDGAAIWFNGEYVDQSGNAYTGTVTVAAKYLPPFDASTSEQMPGMLYAENLAGESGALVTYGMIVVELFGSAGQSLNIASGSYATLIMPVADQQASSAPSTIPLWFFDEVAGYWIEEGSATLMDGNYVGRVNHFTFWNCDSFYDDCQHNGLVLDDAGNPAGNATVEINCAGGANTIGFTNPDGTFFTYLPANQNIDVDVSYGCGGAVTSYAVGPYASNSVNNQTYEVAIGTNVLNVSGTLVNCDLQPVTDADLYYWDGTTYMMFHVDNGIIDFDIPYCSGSSSAELFIYDYDQPYNYFSYTSISISYPTTNLGQVIICDTIGSGPSVGDCDAGEYFDLTIDGNSVFTDSCVTFTYADSSGAQTGFSVWPSADGNFVVSSLDVASVGTFPGTSLYPMNTNEVVFFNGYDADWTQPVNFTTDVLAYGGSGGYLELVLTGTYTDLATVTHNVTLYVNVYIP